MEVLPYYLSFNDFKMRIYAFLVLILTNATLSLGHPSKVSISTLTYFKNLNESVLKVTIFKDDFEEETTIKTERINNKTEKEIFKYIRNHVQIWIDDRSQKLLFDKITSTPKTIVIHVKILDTNLVEASKIKVQNTILLKTFQKQNNIVRIDRYNNSRNVNITLDRGSPAEELIF